LNLLQTTRRPAYEPVITSLINDLARLACQSVLILDDYHVIDAPQIDETIAFLLEHLPAPLHLLILSRTEPSLPLARLRARNEISELRAADLRFSPAETAAFLRQNIPFELPPAAVGALVERTEGWVAGLQLVTLALQRHSPQQAERFLATLSGGQRHVLEYLAPALSVADRVSQPLDGLVV
jgi:LuxR family maltose regulon positive regulatory protein